ncbi:MAG: class I SAM-dependent methyltransferase [Chthoniobacterales bacterium]
MLGFNFFKKIRSRTLSSLLTEVPETYRQKRLHLGCGNIHLDGWCNVDFRKTSATDKVCDVFLLPDDAKNSIGLIYACHVLEHSGLYSNEQMPAHTEVLKRWFDILAPGGILCVAVPDLELVFKGLLKFDGKPESKGFMGALYGGQNYPGNSHFCGFTVKMLTNTLETLGFTSIRPFKSFSKDTSQFILNGLPISLNLAATKPKN